MLTADVAKRQGQISKLITALSDEAIGILIEKRRTVEVVIVGQTAKGSIRILRTTARQRWIEGRFVRAVDRHARYATELEVAAASKFSPLRKRRSSFASRALKVDWPTFSRQQEVPMSWYCGKGRSNCPSGSLVPYNGKNQLGKAMPRLAKVACPSAQLTLLGSIQSFSLVPKE